MWVRAVCLVQPVCSIIRSCHTTAKAFAYRQRCHFVFGIIDEDCAMVCSSSLRSFGIVVTTHFVPFCDDLRNGFATRPLTFNKPVLQIAAIIPVSLKLAIFLSYSAKVIIVTVQTFAINDRVFFERQINLFMFFLLICLLSFFCSIGSVSITHLCLPTV